MNIDLHLATRDKIQTKGSVLFQYICESGVRFAHGFSLSCFDIQKVPIQCIKDWVKVQKNGFCLHDCNMTTEILKAIFDVLLEDPQ